MKRSQVAGDKRLAEMGIGEGVETEAATSAIRWPTFLMVILAVLIAYGLRAYRIDGQSLWYDEGVSSVMAQRDFLSITMNAAADIHPPLYYYLLHVWSWLAGTSELALRWLSLTYGVLLVAMVFKLGQKLFDSWVGLFAALLTAFAPFPIYYSQEARMYMQVAFFGAVSTYLFLDVQRRYLEPEEKTYVTRRKVVLYGLVSIALLYSHYFAFSILAIQNAWMMLRIATLSSSLAARFKSLALWAALQLTLMASFLPWLALSFAQVGGWPSISEPMTLETLLYRVFQVFTFGLSWDAAATERKEQLFFLLGAASLSILLTRRKRTVLALSLAILYFAIPVLAMYLLSLNRPMYNPKFLLLAVPGYFLILGVGLSGLGKMLASVLRRLGVPSVLCITVEVAAAVALLSAALFSMGKSTEAYYFEAKYARDDYRGLARFIQSQIQQGDAIVLEAPGQIEIFTYYFQGKQPIYPLPQERPIDKAKTETTLKTILGEHKRVWLVLWAQREADPDEFLERWLDENAFKSSNTWFGGIRLAQYVAARGEGDGWREKTNLSFGDAIRLEEITLGSMSGKPGDILDITLFWRALRPVAERYTVFLHIIDRNEYLWGQRDSEPGGGKKITTNWSIGDVVEDRHGVPILPGTPPGRYQFEVGLYDQATGQRLPIVAGDGKLLGDRLLFGEIEVTKAVGPSNLDALGMRNRATASFGDDMSLLGFDFHRLGQPETNAEFGRNDYALTTLYWQASAPLRQDYLVRLEVVGRDGNVLLQRIAQPAENSYRTSLWSDGELVRDQHRLALSTLTPGDYSLRVSVLDFQTKMPVPATSSTNSLNDGKALELARFRIR